MKNIIFAAIGGIFGTGVGLFLPKIVSYILRYKCNQRNIETPLLKLSQQTRLTLFILHTGLYAAAFWVMPVPSAVLTCVFITVAIVSAIIDYHIHIIANEVVLFLLMTGIVYRFVDGGFASLIGGLWAFLITIGIFGSAAVFTYWRKGTMGIGAGDLKLVLAIAVTVGYPGVFYFLAGIAVAIIVYCFVGLKFRLLTWNSSFPMCAHIMIGFLTGLFYPYITSFNPLFIG